MLIIGLDVGTTGTKAVISDENGKIIAGGYKEYGIWSETDGKVWQNADDWWDAAVTAIREALIKVADKSEIRAIGMSTQGASMLATDVLGKPLTHVMTWMDNRATAETEYLDKAVGGEKIYRKCGWRLTPAGDAAKILWIKNNLPDVFDAAAYFPSTLEFMNYKLTGRMVSDPTNSAIRQLYNIESGTWDDEMLSAVGISADRLPEVIPVGATVGTLTKEAAEQLGLSCDVTVYNGAHDQYCAALGCGATNAGDMLLATGTTWVVLGVTDRLLYTKSHISPGIHPAKGCYGAMASLISAGSAMKWYRGIIGGDFKDIDAGAAKCTGSASDLLIYPYVAGAGFPHNMPTLHGAMLGIDMRHTKYDVARALMEGVAFEAAGVLDEFASEGMRIKKLMMTGGAARSDIWSEIVGYVTGCEIHRMNEPETCSVGAAMIAAVGEGVFTDYDECRRHMVRSTRLELQDAEMYEYYKEKRARYLEGFTKISGNT